MPLLDTRVFWEWNNQHRLVIYYIPCHGPLENSTQIYIHLGRDGWTQVMGTFMMNQCYSLFQYEVPTEIIHFEQLDFVFTDGNHIWDNNQARDWHLVVKREQERHNYDTHLEYMNQFPIVHNRQVVVFWDIENCAVPSTVSGSYVVHKLIKRMKLFGDVIRL